MPLNRGFLLLVLVVICMVSRVCAFGGTPVLLDDLSPEKAEFFYTCINTIVCDLRMSVEVKRIANSAGPQLYETGLEWLSDCFSLDLDMSDLQDFWVTYCDKVCNQSDDIRRECTKEIVLNYVNFYEDVCENNPSPDECTKSEATLMVASNILEEYTERGECNNPEDIAEDYAHDAEEKMAGEAQKMSPKIPSPGFG